MKRAKVVTIGTLIAAMLSPVVVGAADALTEQQKKAVERVVHDYLVTHPEVLIEASQALQQKQQEDAQQQAKTAIIDNANTLLNGTLSVAGNPKGDVTMVEFFDYQCIHCKKMAPVINELIKKNTNLRVIYKEFPIFGKSSELASQVALAAAMQGKYQAFHEALFKINTRLDEKAVMETAKSVGLNMVQLKKDMSSKTVSQELNANRELAEKMRLMGTPAFVIAATSNGHLKANSEPVFIPGAASFDALQNLVKKAGE